MNDQHNNTESYAPAGAARGKKLSVYLIVALILAAATVCIGTVTTAISFDPGTRYFDDSPLSIALAVCICATLALAFSAMFIFSKTALDVKAEVQGSKVRFIYTIPAISLIVCAAHILRADLHTAVFLLLLVMLALCIVYCLFSIFPSLNKTIAILSGSAQIIFCLYIMISLYFDLQVEINSPFKLLIQFAAASIAVDTCMELRGVISGATFRAHIASKVLCVCLCALTFAITLCAFIREIDLPDSSYLIYSIYFMSQAICSAFAVSMIKDGSRAQDQTPGTLPE